MQNSPVQRCRPIWLYGSELAWTSSGEGIRLQTHSAGNTEWLRPNINGCEMARSISRSCNVVHNEAPTALDTRTAFGRLCISQLHATSVASFFANCCRQHREHYNISSFPLIFSTSSE